MIKDFAFLLCFIDISGKYPWLALLIDKGVLQLLMFFNILHAPKFKGRRPSKTLVSKGNEFYNRSIESWLQYNDTKIFSMHNEGRSAAAEIFIRILKIKIYNYST